MSKNFDNISMSEKEQRSYNNDLRGLASDRATYEFARDRGYKVGFENGLKLAFDQGVIEGEREVLFKIAKKMLDSGPEISFVSEITGISIKELKELN